MLGAPEETLPPESPGLCKVKLQVAVLHTGDASSSAAKRTQLYGSSTSWSDVRQRLVSARILLRTGLLCELQAPAELEHQAAGLLSHHFSPAASKLLRVPLLSLVKRRVFSC